MMLTYFVQCRLSTLISHLLPVTILACNVLISVLINQSINSDYQHPYSIMHYSRTELLQLRSTGDGKISTPLWHHLTTLGVSYRPTTRRGRRGGWRHPRIPVDDNVISEQPYTIPTIIGNRPLPTHQSRGVNSSNLRQLSNCNTIAPKLNACLWNAQSMRNKTIELVDLVLEHDIDIMIITETWLHDDETIIIGEATPPGYSFLNYPRPTITHGGGIGILFKTPLKLSLRKTQCDTKYFKICSHN